MAPPIDSKDEERIARIVRRIVQEETKPLEKDLRKHSGEYRELGAGVARVRSESQHDIDGISMGMERYLKEAFALQAKRQEATDERIEVIVKSIPPMAKTAVDTESAAVAGAKASIAGATAAIDSKTNALAAKVATHRAIVVQIVTVVALAAWQIYEHFK